MKKILLILLLLSTTGLTVHSQTVTISGYVEDETSGERLLNATVYNTKNLKYGTITNSYGFYSLTLPAGKNTITASYVGYRPITVELDLRKDTMITFKLNPLTELDEIVVTDKKDNVKDVQMSTVSIPIKTIKTIPVLLGEVDVLKAVQLLPGVQSGTEGSSGIYVRGGGPDQNLILLDGVPVYNVNHLFGFFSVFNADAISDVTLIKGGFPARYGGRLSSVLDIRMKEGNMKKFKGEASIGLISSKLTIEGPIVKDKTSFILSARRTYADVILAPVIAAFSKAADGVNLWAGYFFHDINAKINHKFSDKDRLYLSVYGGRDKAYANVKDSWDGGKEDTQFDMHWGNITTALRWNHVFTNKLFGNATFTYSKYNFVTEIEDKYSYSYNNRIYNSKFYLGYLSGIYDYSAKIDFDYLPNASNKFKTGMSYTHHIFKPGVAALKYTDDEYQENLDTTFGGNPLLAEEVVGYIEDNITIGSKLKINVGGHASLFRLKDTTYYSFEPRISARFLITDRWSLKASYAKMQQYLHLLTNSTLGLPTDLWLPATKKVPPQKSWQVALGTVFGLSKTLDLSIEGFYKEMSGLIEYKEGSSFFDDPEEGIAGSQQWEKKVEIGKGWSYGAEFLIKKDIGKFTGWIGYTLSWSLRQFDNISFGRVFPYRYDRRHDISIVMTYKFNDRIDAGLTWVYGTGIAVTLPMERYASLDLINNYQTSDYFYSSETITYFETRNNFRYPDYHRLDLGVNFRKQKKHGVRTLSIGVYNAYNRINPFYLDYQGGFIFDSNITNTKKKIYKVGLFPIMPFITYKFSF